MRAYVWFFKNLRKMQTEEIILRKKKIKNSFKVNK